VEFSRNEGEHEEEICACVALMYVGAVIVFVEGLGKNGFIEVEVDSRNRG